MNDSNDVAARLQELDGRRLTPQLLAEPDLDLLHELPDQLNLWSCVRLLAAVAFFEHPRSELTAVAQAVLMRNDDIAEAASQIAWRKRSNKTVRLRHDALANLGERFVRIQMAIDPATPASTLATLVEDLHLVRTYLAENPSLTDAMRERLTYLRTLNSLAEQERLRSASSHAVRVDAARVSPGRRR